MWNLFLIAQDDSGSAFAAVAMLVLLSALGVALLAAYCLPIIVAFMRGHPNTAAIAVLTVFLGWSLIGWAVALAWAFTAIERPRYRNRDDD